MGTASVRRHGIVLALLIGAATIAPAAAPAAAGPDLVQTAVSSSASTVPPAGTLTVTDTAKNRGRRTARASATGYYLSLDNEKGAGDVALGTRSVRPLRRGKTSSGSAAVSIPAITPPGR